MSDLDVPKSLKDAAYVAVGLGVLGFQRAQVRRHELTRQLQTQRDQLRVQLYELAKAADSQAGAVRSQVKEVARTIDQRVQPARQQLDERIDEIESRLPTGAREVVESVRAAAQLPEQLMRSLVGLDS